MTDGPVFPAAAPAEQPHPRNCACVPCLDALLAEMSTPLVTPAPRVDPVLAVRPPAPRRAPDDWSLLDANRATRGPGTGGGAGRRPSGPGKRRKASGKGKGGICGLLVAALVLAWLVIVATVALVATH